MKIINLYISEKNKKIVFTTILFIIILFVRKNTFENYIINIDEAEWIYCIKRMYNNPLPFVGFDANTTGPISIYILSPLLSFTKNLTIVHLRIYGLILLFIPILLFIRKKMSEFLTKSIIYTSLLIINEREFFAYNTEWILIPILFIIYEKINEDPNVKSIIIINLLILTLPLIKLQSILFSILFGLIILIKLIKIKNKKLTILFISSIAIIALIYLTCLTFSSGYDNFKYLYIERNFYYSHLMKWNKSYRDILYIFRFKIYTIFYFHLIILCLIIPLYLIKKQKINITNSIYKVEYAILSVAILTILIPKTNFTHYFQILFFPFTILISKYILKTLEQKYINKKTIIYLLSITLITNIINKAFNQENINNENLNIVIPDTYELEKIINKKYNVFILGWFESIPLYYKLRNKINFINPSAHTFFLTTFHQFPKKNYYINELNRTLTSIQKSKFILDPEGVITILNEKKINNLIKEKFKVISKYRKGYIFKNKTKWK